MSERIITLTVEQVVALRGRGETYDRSGGPGSMVRLLRDGSGYKPLPNASDQIVLSTADLDLIESPDGLHCASTDGTTGWLVRVVS